MSSIANADSPGQAITMLLRAPGRYTYLAVIALLVCLAEPVERRRIFVARAMALLGTAEAVFGLAAFFLPLGGIGLEPTRKFSVLYFEVPGRIAGTLGISPNFLGAIFILTIVLSAGLATDASARRERILWWATVLVQVFALVLTFTRASLGLAIVVLAVLLLIRGRVRYMVPVLAIVAFGFLITPSRTLAPGSPGSGGTSAPVAVERLTSDIPDRLALWTSATLMMIDHPLTGVGPGQTLVAAAANPDRYVQTEFGAAVNNAHNTILLAGAESGVAAAIGSLIVNLAIAIAALRVLFQLRRRRISAVETAGALAVLGYLAQGMVNNLFNVAAAGVVFAVVAGAFVIRLEYAPSAQPVADDPGQRQRPDRPTARAQPVGGRPRVDGQVERGERVDGQEARVEVLDACPESRSRRVRGPQPGAPIGRVADRDLRPARGVEMVAGRPADDRVPDRDRARLHVERAVRLRLDRARVVEGLVVEHLAEVYDSDVTLFVLPT